MEELTKYDSATVENLLSEVKQFFLSKGIMLTKNFSGDQSAKSETLDPALWIKPFILQASAPAFYLDINSPDDISAKNEDLKRRLDNLQSELKNFLHNNSDLNEGLAKKINMLAFSVLTRTQQVVKFGLKSSLDKDIENCKAVEELREVAGRRYGEFLKRYFLEEIMVPLYDGLKQSPNESAYLYVLNKVNNFLADLGVKTVDISVGEKFDENLPYTPVAESDSAQYVTANAEEKDIIREIFRYAYAFQENNGAENYLIMEGEVAVMIYRPGGAQ